MICLTTVDSLHGAVGRQLDCTEFFGHLASLDSLHEGQGKTSGFGCWRIWARTLWLREGGCESITSGSVRDSGCNSPGLLGRTVASMMLETRPVYTRSLLNWRT